MHASNRLPALVKQDVSVLSYYAVRAAELADEAVVEVVPLTPFRIPKLVKDLLAVGGIVSSRCASEVVGDANKVVHYFSALQSIVLDDVLFEVVFW